MILEEAKQNVSFFIYVYSRTYIGKSLNNSDYKLSGMILLSDRGCMYKCGIYKTKTIDINLITSMSAPYVCTHNLWIETINGQASEQFIRTNFIKSICTL